jgi:NAD(P)-dependent dehydrogenase (short-subunit alcohol dehydrogenase family)
MAMVKVMRLDTEDYESVQSFAKAFRAEHLELHLLMLNAGIGTLKRELTPTGHEKNVQVNYLSNVLLMLELLPLLNALANKAPLQPSETVVGHFDSEDSFVVFTRYADSKLLSVLFLYEMQKHLVSDTVIVNSFCPGMVDTGTSDVLPIYLRFPVNAIRRSAHARPRRRPGLRSTQRSLQAQSHTESSIATEQS